jgi:hypothetical protein
MNLYQDIYQGVEVDCPFCEQSGGICNEECMVKQLHAFETICVSMFRDLGIIQAFRLWLTNEFLTNTYTIRIARTFATRYCRCSAFANFIDCVDKIITYINETYSAYLTERETDAQQQLVPYQFNRIPISRLYESIQESMLHTYVHFINVEDEDLVVRPHPPLPMFVNEPYTLMYFPRTNYEICIEENTSESADTTVADCNICWETKTCKEFAKLDCHHQFCITCIGSLIKPLSEFVPVARCALCRTDIKKLTCQTEDAKRSLEEYI